NINSFNRPDKRSLVIYELLVRDFVKNHDWKTLKDSLNYLKTLGINAIEVMPFNEFEGNDSWGYNTSFYFAPDKYYGPENTLKQFIDSCHKIGIAVIMDMVLNHSFGSSPMVQLYFDNQNNRPASNNPWFNPVPKHAFNVGYDMNHESPDTKYLVSRVMEHWTQQYKIDGFRFDLSKGFTQKQTCDNTGNNCDVAAFGAYDSSRIAIWKGYYDSLQLKAPNTYAILEHFADNSEEKVLSDYGMMLWGIMNANYAQASMGYLTPDPGGNPPDFTRAIYSNRGWSNPFLVAYMESHDEERIMYKNEQFGNSSGSYNVKDIPTGLKRIELDNAFFYTIPGPKMLWQFGELGYDYSINTCSDGITIDPNCRLADKPIRWDYLADPNRKHLHDEVASLINLRFNPLYKDVFITGTTTSSLGAAFKWLTVRSASDSSDLLVIGNFDVNPQSGSVTFPTSGTWYDYLNNTTFSATGSSQAFMLQPGEFHVYINRNLNNLNPLAVVNVPGNLNGLQALLYPNPAVEKFTIQLNIPESGKGTIDLFSLQGQFLKNLKTGFLYKGQQELTFKRPSLPSGTYFIKITAKSGTKTIKLTL
ncbi:MAG TPA: alpha-amylase family glycosyl hydrolase, partial [Flavisolibacter sp.]|nr:alpha-amylase family glycosyl hydrolase [Flavisolibacter sp.]